MRHISIHYRSEIPSDAPYKDKETLVYTKENLSKILLTILDLGYGVCVRNIRYITVIIIDTSRYVR